MTQHLAVEKQDRTLGLILRRRRNPALDREVTQKGLDFVLSHARWMAFAVEKE